MLHWLQAVKGGWRRIDVAISIPSAVLKVLAHTLCIEKREPRAVRSRQFTELMVDVMHADVCRSQLLRRAVKLL